MDPIQKYPTRASFKIVNIQRRISRNDFAPIIRPTSENWFPRSYLSVRRAGTRINFRLNFAIHKDASKLRMQIYMRLVNKDPKKSQIWEIEKEVKRDEFIYTLEMEVGEILNLENGWLIDGTLKFECGAYVKAILKTDGIWKFYFWDPVYDYHKSDNGMVFSNEEEMGFYCYKQLPTFHSPNIDSGTVDHIFTFDNYFNLKDVENCLQLVHGVRMIFGESKLKSIIPIARSMKLYNVVHYCQYQLMVYKESVEDLQFAFEFNTHHYLAHLLGLVDSREELKEILKDVNIQMMSGESMKQCTRFFFYVDI